VQKLILNHLVQYERPAQLCQHGTATNFRSPGTSPAIVEELAVEGDDDSITIRLRPTREVDLEVDRTHDPVPALLVNQLLERRAIYGDRLHESVDRRVTHQRRIRAAGGLPAQALRHRIVQLQQLTYPARLLRRHRMPAEQRGRRPDQRSAERLGDGRPGQPAPDTCRDNEFRGHTLAHDRLHRDLLISESPEISKACHRRAYPTVPVSHCSPHRYIRFRKSRQHIYAKG